MSQFLVSEKDPECGAQFGPFPSFAAAEAFVLECVALHAKRRALELKHFPEGEALAPDYQRVATDRWDAGLYGYDIVAYEPDQHDPIKAHLAYLRQRADEKLIAEEGQWLREWEPDDATKQRLTDTLTPLKYPR